MDDTMKFIFFIAAMCVAAAYVSIRGCEAHEETERAFIAAGYQDCLAGSIHYWAKDCKQ